MTKILSWNDERTAIGLAVDYPDGTVVAAHAHDRAQILYALRGIVTVRTARGSWMTTPDRGLWIPPETVHEVAFDGGARMRTLYLRPGALPHMPAICASLAVTTLAGGLISEISALPRPPCPVSEQQRDQTLVTLLLHELPRLVSDGLHLPMPGTPGLRTLCERFVSRPSAHLAIETWADELHVSRRSFTRHFRHQTGISLGEWRQRACMLSAIPRLQAGASVTEVAIDLGYDNPAAFSAMFRRLTGDIPSRYHKG